MVRYGFRIFTLTLSIAVGLAAKTVPLTDVHTVAQSFVESEVGLTIVVHRGTGASVFVLRRHVRAPAVTPEAQSKGAARG